MVLKEANQNSFVELYDTNGIHLKQNCVPIFKYFLLNESVHCSLKMIRFPYSK